MQVKPNTDEPPYYLTKFHFANSAFDRWKKQTTIMNKYAETTTKAEKATNPPIATEQVYYSRTYSEFLDDGLYPIPSTYLAEGVLFGVRHRKLVAIDSTI